MTEQEKILSRVREALRVPSPLPGAHAAPTGSQPELPLPRSAAAHARQWLPAVPPTFDEQVALFQTQSDELKSAFRKVPSVDDLATALGDLAQKQAWKRVAAHSGDLTFRALQNIGLPVLMTDAGYDVNELEACDAGITECDALIAQTGSVLLTSRTAGGRALSVLPPHHVVLARATQLVPDLPAAFELLAKVHAWNYPSFISLITGPSRTGDIERILVLGAHGPKQLTILMAAD